MPGLFRECSKLPSLHAVQGAVLRNDGIQVGKGHTKRREADEYHLVKRISGLRFCP